tara:strand:+ start:1734 stop:1880 length:147 start_codon:yes stop_codon:yes gene_type:complete
MLATTNRTALDWSQNLNISPQKTLTDIENGFHKWRSLVSIFGFFNGAF